MTAYARAMWNEPDLEHAHAPLRLGSRPCEPGPLGTCCMCRREVGLCSRLPLRIYDRVLDGTWTCSDCLSCLTPSEEPVVAALVALGLLVLVVLMPLLLAAWYIGLWLAGGAR